MTNVTVLFLDETFPSLPLVQWRLSSYRNTVEQLHGLRPACHFHVTTNLVAAESAPSDTSSAACGRFAEWIPQKFGR